MFESVRARLTLWYVSALSGERRRPLVGKLQRFLSTPEAMHAMHSGDGGVPAQRFKPPVYVTIWSAVEPRA